MIKEKVFEAYEYAKEKHKGQKRRFSGAPQFVHPKAVARIVEQLTSDPDLVCAALLHDVIEDTEATYQEILDKFGQKVADLVEELTSGKEKRGGRQKADYLREKVAQLSEGALLIKLADRLHNLMYLERDVGGADFEEFIPYYYRETQKVFGDLLRDRSELSPPQKALVAKIDAILQFINVIHKVEGVDESTTTT